jgi:hypothetical protein
MSVEGGGVWGVVPTVAIKGIKRGGIFYSVVSIH